MNLFQKLAVTSVAALSSLAAINANPAQAAIITYATTAPIVPISVGLPLLGFGATSSFPQFDPGLGILTSVSLDVNLAETIDYTCSSFPAGCTANSVISSTLGSPSSPILSLSEVIPLPSPIEFGTGSFPFSASLSGTGNANLGDLYGSGTVPLQTDILIAFPRLIRLFLNVSGTEEATLTYTYTPARSVPEPSTNLGLDALALVGIGGLLLRKKIAPSTKSRRTI